jgi:hypothetical protein
MGKWETDNRKLETRQVFRYAVVGCPLSVLHGLDAGLVVQRIELLIYAGVGQFGQAGNVNSVAQTESGARSLGVFEPWQVVYVT